MNANRTRTLIILLLAVCCIVAVAAVPVYADDTELVIGFEKVTLKVSAERYTSLLVGPDERLYGSTLAGNIYRWDIASDGTLTNEQLIYTETDRIIIGLDFDPRSTPDRLLLWYTHNYNALDASPLFSSSLALLTGENIGQPAETWTAKQMIEELPRSYKDHMANGLDFGPDGALYMLVGSNSAAGDGDETWNNRLETLLSAALLRVDTLALEQLPNLPLNVRTAEMNPDGSQNPDKNYGLGDPRLAEAGLYDPLAPGAPVTIYATGFRNPYDLVWTEDGQLYVPVNGTAAGGNVPGTPAELPIACQNRIDYAIHGEYTGPAVEAGRNLDAQPDNLARIEPGGYYGHPNYTRCEWVLNGGNPTEGFDRDEARGSQYPVGTLPDRNFRSYAYVFGMHTSSNGVVEYRSDAFNGELKGRLLVVNYNFGSDIVLLTRGKYTDDGEEMIVGADVAIPGFTGFRNPLDLTEDARNGNLYVSEYGANTITLLRPTPLTKAEAAQNRLNEVAALNNLMLMNTIKIVVIVVTMLIGAWLALGALWVRRQRLFSQTITVAREVAPILIVVAVMAAGTLYLTRDTVRNFRLLGRMTQGQKLPHHINVPDPSRVIVTRGEYVATLPEDGPGLFLYICASCHGPDAAGLPNSGVSLLANEFIRSHSDEELLQFIIVGREADAPDNLSKIAMPARGGNPNLTDEQIAIIIDYLRTLQ